MQGSGIYGAPGLLQVQFAVNHRLRGSYSMEAGQNSIHGTL